MWGHSCNVWFQYTICSQRADMLDKSLCIEYCLWHTGNSSYWCQIGRLGRWLWAELNRVGPIYQVTSDLYLVGRPLKTKLGLHGAGRPNNSTWPGLAKWVDGAMQADLGKLPSCNFKQSRFTRLFELDASRLFSCNHKRGELTIGCVLLYISTSLFLGGKRAD